MEDIQTIIVPLLRKYNISKAAFFGSYARGNNNVDSDIDLLIQPPRSMGLEFIRLKRELEEKLHKPVDLVSYDGISPYLRQSILQYEKTLYEEQ